MYYYPRVYDHYLPPATLKDFPHLAYLVNSTRIHHPPYFSVSSNLTSLAGMPLTNFAKFTYFGAGKVFFFFFLRANLETLNFSY